MDEPPFDLERFITAQDQVWPRVVSELTAGRKQTHWMWFVFPQIAGLGVSPTAVRYAVPNLDAATAYLRHDILGPRLIDATTCVLAHKNKTAEAIFGAIDAMKFRSSMTLFAAVPGADEAFRAALDAFYDGNADDRTLTILNAQN